MNIISIILLTFLKTAFARKCYKCIADSDKACDEKQREISCTNEEQCITLKYTTGFQERRVFKSCQNKKFSCDKQCPQLLKAGNKSCKTSCCDRDYCNKPTVEKKAIGSKRSITENVSNSSTYSKISSIAIHVVLVMQLVAWITLNRL